MMRLAKYAWAVLAYNLAVVLWGAYVRASGSGAGCGSHWPLCNGVILPRTERVATLVEFTHRVSSGVALLLVVGLVIWAWRTAPRGHRVRAGAAASLVFMLGEAVLGAGLVLFALVAKNASLTRAFSLGAHLLNTFLLLGSIALTAWWASGGPPVRLRGRGALPWALGGGLVAMLALGASGAITALGDTLFPAGSLREGFRQDLSPTTHLLVRLRVLHPALAILTGLLLIAVAAWAARAAAPVVRNPAGAPMSDGATPRLAHTLAGLVLLQWLAGTLNVVLLAPLWLQFSHLLLADLVWISLVLLTASALGEREPEAPGRAAVAGRDIAAGGVLSGR
ncbi:MAG TPA: COX15/CtaA family protein [Gemmatimonadales bacterium]|nr:COX15/CtaA family protein [Gemmatimonadales bacterium]